jgi:hypothetical protein
MPEINNILRLREQYPMYDNKSDQELVEGLHKRFYSDRPIEDVYKHLNYQPTAPLASTQIGEDIAGFGRAVKSFHGSVQRAASSIDEALWSIISDPKAAGSALWDIVSDPAKAGSQVKDYVNERYGSMERAKKTVENDPAGFILDASTAASGSGALVRKLGMAVTKTGRAVIPTLTAKGAGLEAGTLKTAGEAGLKSGAEAAEYKAGVAGKPLASEIKPRAAEADPLPAGFEPQIGVAKAQEAQKALAAQREAAQAELAPYGQAGQAVRAGGLAPNPKMVAATGAAALTGNLPAAAGMAGMTAATSPRLLGGTMYGLGAMERGAQILSRTRTAIAAGAAALLKDREAKKELPPADVKTLRAATRDDAGSSTMLAASRILGTRPSSYGGSDIAPQYGGIGGDRVVTPSPGQPSVPSGGPGTDTGPVPGPAGPGPAGTPPAGPGASPPGAAGALAGSGPLPLPGQSPGLSRLPTTGQEPVAETHGGQTLMQFMWDKMLKGADPKALSEKLDKFKGELMESGRTAFEEPHKFDPAAPTKAAWNTLTGGARFAPRGVAGTSVRYPLFHGSPETGLTELAPSTRGPLGPGVYTSPAKGIANSYAGPSGKVYQLPDAKRDIFLGHGHRTDEEWFGHKNDKKRLVAAAEPDKRAAVQAILDKGWSNDGYSIYQNIMRLYGGDAPAQTLFKKAGFQGVSGLVDGPELLLFEGQKLVPAQPMSK